MPATLPPRPRLPKAVQFALIWRRTIPYLDWCHRRLGDCFTVWTPPFGNLVYVADPKEVKRIFTGDPALFHAGDANAELLAPLLGNRSLLVLDEDDHLNERRVLLPHFHGESVKRYADTIAEIAAAEVDRWQPGSTVWMRHAMQRISLETILRAVIGVSDGPRYARLREMLPKAAGVTPLIQAMWLRPELARFGPWKRYMRMLAETDALLHEEIAARRADPARGERADILSLLIGAQRADGSRFTDTDLRDELMTLLVAGHETTATGLAWAVERLIRHPQALARAAGGDDDYLEAVVKETLRVRPVIADVVRRVTQDTEIAGYRVPKGWHVLPAIALLQRSPRHYDEALEFRPERFLDGGAPPYTWIPFGGGVRRCIGAAFATLEMKVVLRTMLERVELAPTRARPEAARVSGVMMLPAHEGEAAVVRRLPQPRPDAAVPISA